MTRGDRRNDRRAFPVCWQEQAEAYERTNVGPSWKVPAWDQLTAEAIRTRAALLEDEAGRAYFLNLYTAHAHHIGTITTPPPESFTATNAQHFQILPSVERIKTQAVTEALRVQELNISPALLLTSKLMGWGDAGKPRLSDVDRTNIETVVRAEQSHLLFHKAMWRGHGRRVLVLDPVLYTLLANTELPSFPAAILAAPWPAFYVQLPPRAFEFEVHDIRTGSVDRRFAEGVAVAIDYPDPEHEGPRELAFMVMGQDEGNGPEGRNVAFATVRFGPDAPLTDFERKMSAGRGLVSPNPRQAEAGLEYGNTDFVGAEDLRVRVPRMIVGLLLYLTSEHPDIVPVAPVERRTFADVRSPNQRAAALARQADELRAATRLPVLAIGTRLGADALRTATNLDRAAAGFTRGPLEERQYVRGFWRWQSHGPGNALRKHMWIKPFWRGPDAAESMKIRAAKLPAAQLNQRETHGH